MRRPRLVVPVVCLAILGACSKDPKAAHDEHLQRGDAFLTQNKLPEAIIEYRNAVDSDPRSVTSRRKLAEAFLKNNDLKNALDQFVRAADLAPKDAELQLKAGQMLQIGGLYEDAKTRAELTLALQPANVEALVLKGSAYAGLKSFDKALAEYEAAIRADPSAGLGYSALGVFQMSRGNIAQAEADFKKALSLSPKDVSVQISLANLYWSTNRRPEAEKAIRSALEVEPKNIQANRALVMILDATNRKAEAEAAAKVVAEITPNPSGWFALAEYYATEGRPEDAKRVLEKLAADPAAASTAKLRLSGLALSAGDRASAHRLLDEVIAKESTNIQALVGKSHLQFTEGKVAEALATVRAAIQADPSSYQ